MKGGIAQRHLHRSHATLPPWGPLPPTSAWGPTAQWSLSPRPSPQLFAAARTHLQQPPAARFPHHSLKTEVRVPAPTIAASPLASPLARSAPDRAAPRRNRACGLPSTPHPAAAGGTDRRLPHAPAAPASRCSQRVLLPPLSRSLCSTMGCFGGGSKSAAAGTLDSINPFSATGARRCAGKRILWDLGASCRPLLAFSGGSAARLHCPQPPAQQDRAAARMHAHPTFAC